MKRDWHDFDEGYDRYYDHRWTTKLRRFGRGAFHLGRYVGNRGFEIGTRYWKKHGEGLTRFGSIVQFGHKLNNRTKEHADYEKSHSIKNKVDAMQTPAKTPRKGRSHRRHRQSSNPRSLSRMQTGSHSRTRKALSGEGFGHNGASGATTQLVSGVEEYVEVTHGRKLNKKERMLKSLSAPVLGYIHVPGSAAGYPSPGNEAAMFTFYGYTNSLINTIVSQAVTQTVGTTPSADIQDTQVLIKSLTNKFTITNKGPSAMKMTFYDHLSAKDGYLSVSNLSLLEAQNEGQSGTFAGKLYLNFNPTNYKTTKLFWTKKHSHVFYIAAYETVQIIAVLHPNMMISPAQVGDSDLNIRHLTQCFTFVSHGVQVADRIADGYPEIAPTEFTLIQEKTSVVVPYPLPAARVNQYMGGLPGEVAVSSLMREPEPKTETKAAGNTGME